MKKILTFLLAAMLFLLCFVFADEQSSGCCSWHGGVCDCIYGRVICCDGTRSPTCRC